MPSISVVLPAYNEAEDIAGNLQEVICALEPLQEDYEIVLVDDGSTDDTLRCALQVVREHPRRVRILRYEVNQGKGNALMAGAAAARGDVIAFLDADMDLHPSQLCTFLEIMRQTGAAAVIGSKRHPDSRIAYPRIRQIYSAGYYTLVRLLFGLPLRDTQTGIKLFRAELLKDVLPRILAKRFAFDIEVLATAHHLGYSIVDAPVVHRFNRRYGRINYPEVWRIFLDTLAIFYRLRILRYYDAKHSELTKRDDAIREISGSNVHSFIKSA